MKNMNWFLSKIKNFRILLLVIILLSAVLTYLDYTQLSIVLYGTAIVLYIVCLGVEAKWGNGIKKGG